MVRLCHCYHSRPAQCDHISTDCPPANVECEIGIHSAAGAMATWLIYIDQYLFDDHAGRYDMDSIHGVDNSRVRHLFHVWHQK